MTVKVEKGDISLLNRITKICKELEAMEIQQNKRKQYSTGLKANVALKAVRGEKTVSELASQQEIHLAIINNWKRPLKMLVGYLRMPKKL